MTYRRAAAALLALVMVVQLSSMLPPKRSEPVPPAFSPALPPFDSTAPLDVVWLIGALGEGTGSIVAPQRIPDTTSRQALTLSSGIPLRTVPRRPHYNSLSRPAALAAQPNGSLHIERLPPGAPSDAITPCLTAVDPYSRRLQVRQWTVEVVVLLLDTPHFGHVWQTIIGRNGFNINQTSSEEAALPSLALKLKPNRHFLLQAWVETDGDSPRTTKLVSEESNHAAQPDTWYHLVLQFNNQSAELYVNGRLEVHAWWGGMLAPPARESDGDFTFGCGMHAGTPADTCSCLLSEGRFAARALSPEEWLWRMK